MTQIEQLENALEQLKRYGQEQLRLEPNHPRNKFKYTIGCADAPDDLYTNSLKKAKSLCLEMSEKYNRMSVVEDSKTFKTVFSVCQDNFISGTSARCFIATIDYYTYRSNKHKMKLQITLTQGQYDHLYNIMCSQDEIIDYLNESDDFDPQTFDNLFDAVCAAKEVK